MLGLTRGRPIAAAALAFAGARTPDSEVAAALVDGGVRRSTYRALDARSRRAAAMLRRLGVRAGGRVATLAWNDLSHLEIVCAAVGIGAECLILDPDIGPTQILARLGRGRHAVLFASPDMASRVDAVAAVANGCLRRVVMLCDAEDMPVLRLLPPDVGLHCYERLLAAESAADEWSAGSGAADAADTFGLRAADRVLAFAAMHDAIEWGLLARTAMAGAALLLPGGRLDAAGALAMCVGEHVTALAAAPALCAGVLGRLTAFGAVPPSLRRVLYGGATPPDALRQGFAAFDIAVARVSGDPV